MKNSSSPAVTAKSIFFAACEISDPHEQSRFIKESCNGNQTLTQAVEGLLAANSGASNNLLVRAVKGLQPDLSESENALKTATLEPLCIDDTTHPIVDRYKLLEEIGRGGMGTVYMAQQTEPVKRRVALKVINPGMDSREVIARFESERQALAMMDHPNIARVFDGGTTEQGRPYFVMELVRGVPITEYCDKHALHLNDRLQLFNDLCQAVQHAHQKGIIHRDLKPSNVQITNHDGKPVVKVIDFGVAKALHQDLTDRTLYTQFSQLVGTPLYMSPEQADRHGLDVDTRSDVYSLGVLLYELLTGTTPFDREELSKAGVEDVRRVICTVEPPRPSVRVSTMKAADDSTLDLKRELQAKQNRLGYLLRGDLDWIVMKALSKDRNDRYESASALAQDIQRHLENEPIEAKPPTILTRLAKWSRRHVVLVWTALAAAILLTVCSSLAIALLAKSRQAALDQRNSAIKQRDISYRNLYVAQMRMGQKDWEDGQIARLKRTLLQYVPLPGEPDMRGWEWYYHLSRCSGDRKTLEGHLSSVRTLAWSGDGTSLAISSSDKIIVWNPKTDDLLTTIPRGGVSGGLFNWNQLNRRLATEDSDGNIEVMYGETHFTIKDANSESVAWSPDGERIATSGSNKTVVIWDAATGKTVRKLVGHDTRIRRVAWSPNGKHLAASGNGPGGITVWDVETGETKKTLKSGQWNNCIAWSPDSTRLAAGTFFGNVFVWEISSGRKMLELSDKGHMLSLDWSPDSAQIATGIRGHTVTLWDATSGKQLRKLQGHSGLITTVDWSPDGRWIASADNSGIVKIWDAGRDPVAFTLADDAELGGVAISPDDRRLAYWALGQTIKVYDLATRNQLHALPGPVGNALPPVWSPDGKHLACGGDDGSIVIYDSLQGIQVRKWKHEEATVPYPRMPVVTVAWHPDGQQLASASRQSNTVRIWDISTGEEISSFEATLPSGGTFAVEWSPDGERIATVMPGRTLIWDRVGWRRLHSLKESGHLKWGEDGHYLAVGGDRGDPRVKVVDTLTGRVTQTLSGHFGGAEIAGWSEDGQRIATCGPDGVRIWDTQTGQEMLSLRNVKSMAWSHDRKRIAAISDGKVLIYDASIGYEIAKDPSYQSQRARALLDEADSLSQNGDFRQAILNIEAAVRLAQVDGKIQSQAAWLMLTLPEKRLRDITNAMAFARRGTELSPNVAWNWMVLGIAQYRQGQYSEARDSLLKLIELDQHSEHPRTSCFLAMTYWQLGDKTTARRHYDDAAQCISRSKTDNAITLGFRDEAAAVLGIENDE